MVSLSCPADFSKTSQTHTAVHFLPNDPRVPPGAHLRRKDLSLACLVYVLLLRCLQLASEQLILEALLVEFFPQLLARLACKGAERGVLAERCGRWSSARVGLNHGKEQVVELL